MRTQHRAQVGRLALAFTLVSGLAVAGPAPKPTKDRISEDVTMDGQARVAHEAFIRVGQNRIIEVPVTVDVSKVLRDGRLAVLGAYVARVDFDKEAVQFLGVRRGSDKHFGEPTVTLTDDANKWGFAKIVDVQADVDEPTGTVNVAVARFREKVDGGADSIYVTFESIATSLMRDASGNVIGTSDWDIPVRRDEGDQKHALVAPNPLAGPGTEAATPGTSTPLRNFVFFMGVPANGSNGSATDNCTAAGSIVRLAPRIGGAAGTDITNATFFPAGVTPVTFRFQDAALNIGTANANATVEIWGDINLTYTISASDLTILRQVLAGAISCPTPPALRCDLADNNRDTFTNATDLLRLRQYLAFVLPCLI